MSWVKLDDRLPHHRKVRALQPYLAFAAYGLYVASIQHCQRENTDGHITANDLDLIFPAHRFGTGKRVKTPIRLQDELVSELVRVGLWDVESKGVNWSVHDYLDWNLSAAERLEQSRINAKAAFTRWGRLPDANRTATRIAKRTAKRINSDAKRNAPPLPSRTASTPVVTREVTASDAPPDRPTGRPDRPEGVSPHRTGNPTDGRRASAPPDPAEDPESFLSAPIDPKPDPPPGEDQQAEVERVLADVASRLGIERPPRARPSVRRRSSRRATISAPWT
jgi:hypothetical protein